MGVLQNPITKTKKEVRSIKPATGMVAVNRPTINYPRTTSVHTESANPLQFRMQQPLNPIRLAFLVAGAGSYLEWRQGISLPHTHSPAAPHNGAQPKQSPLQRPSQLTAQSKIKNAQPDRAFCASPADPSRGFQCACRAADRPPSRSQPSFDNRQRLHWIRLSASGKSRDSPSQASPSWASLLKRS